MSDEDRKEARRRYYREYHQKNKERRRALQQTEEWKTKNREKAKKNREARTPEQQAAYLEYQRAYREANHETLLEKNRERAKRCTEEEKLSWAVKKYGLTAEDYKSRCEQQDGCCAICRNPPDAKKRLVVDHCHTSGRVRGLLCGHCNIMIGQAKENPNTLQQAISYLNENK